MSAAVLAGLGGCLPARTVTNGELAGRLDTTDAWIRTRTGIRARRLVEPGTTTADLAVRAGELALKSAGDVIADAVILATTTPDRRCPATAPEVAARLGLTGVAACDLQAVCTGFIYGLAASAGLISAGTAARVLLICAETYSTIIDLGDRATAVIFADGAGAVVLRAGHPGEPGAIGPIELGSDGGQSDLIEIPAGGRYFRMLGSQVYRQAMERMAASARVAIERAGWRPADVDRFAPHQANARLSAAVAARLGFDDATVLSNIAEVGNTSAASIPLLLTQAASAGLLRAGHRVLLTAFGGGLTWGSTTLTWPEITPLADDHFGGGL